MGPKISQVLTARMREEPATLAWMWSPPRPGPSVACRVYDDGQIFHGSGAGDPFGPRCVEGDIMGCGIMFPRDYILDDEDDTEEDLDLLQGAEKGAFQNVLYQNGEEEEEEAEGDEPERGNESRKVVAFFTRNGKLMGRRQVVVPPGGFYPTIGMLSRGEKVKVDLHPLSG